MQDIRISQGYCKQEQVILLSKYKFVDIKSQLTMRTIIQNCNEMFEKRFVLFSPVTLP